MQAWGHRRKRGAALAALMFCVLASTSYGAPSKVTQPGAFLDEAESMRIKDHERFVQLLAQIHSESPTLTPEERWHLKYLDAYEASLEGNFAAAEMPLRDVIDHSGNPALAAKASSALLTNLAASHRYEEAFTLAHQLTSELPHIQDQSARFAALGTLSQMLNLAGPWTRLRLHAPGTAGPRCCARPWPDRRPGCCRCHRRRR